MPSSDGGFQFLIGRLETKDMWDYLGYRMLFQFLIGRLETPLCLPGSEFPGMVSIPHR